MTKQRHILVDHTAKPKQNMPDKVPSLHINTLQYQIRYTVITFKRHLKFVKPVINYGFICRSSTLWKIFFLRSSTEAYSALMSTMPFAQPHVHCTTILEQQLSPIIVDVHSFFFFSHVICTCKCPCYEFTTSPSLFLITLQRSPVCTVFDYFCSYDINQNASLFNN